MLKDLTLTNFRCFAENNFNFTDGINLITGKNGSGKSSLLEAIYLAGRGRSFRSNYLSDLIKNESQESFVFLQLQDDSTSLLNKLGSQIKNNKLTLRYNNSPITKRSDLLDILPIQLVTPISHMIIDSGPVYRRKFIDWGLFHVEHKYRQVWSSFNRVLKQRNQVLKDKSSELKFWNEEFIKLSEQLNEYRECYFSELDSHFNSIQSELVSDSFVSLEYKPGWNTDIGLEKTLSSNIKRDIQYGFTHAGPHKADIKFNFLTSKRNSLSRGQQKMIVFTLQISQCLHLYSKTDIQPLLMIDDISSELDTDYLHSLLNLIHNLSLQTIVTAIKKDPLYEPHINNMFHVEQC